MDKICDFLIDVLRFFCCFFAQSLEPLVHGRGRNADSLEDTYFGVHQEQLYARKLKPVEGTHQRHLCCFFFLYIFRGRSLNTFCLDLRTHLESYVTYAFHVVVNRAECPFQPENLA